MLPSFNLKTYLLGLLSFMLVIQVNAQESQADLGQINVPNPSTYIENYEYDAASGLYYYNVKVGEYDISYPIILTPDEYQELILKEDLKRFQEVTKTPQQRPCYGSTSIYLDFTFLLTNLKISKSGIGLALFVIFFNICN